MNRPATAPIRSLLRGRIAQLIKTWIENITVFEILPPEFAKPYLEAAAKTKSQVLADLAAAKSGSDSRT